MSKVALLGAYAAVALPDGIAIGGYLRRMQAGECDFAFPLSRRCFTKRKCGCGKVVPIRDGASRRGLQNRGCENGVSSCREIGLLQKYAFSCALTSQSSKKRKSRGKVQPLLQKRSEPSKNLIRLESGKRDSNSRPQPWQGCALPTELFPQTLCNFHCRGVISRTQCKGSAFL